MIHQDATPLSDCISSLVAERTRHKWELFVKQILVARLGVVAHGIPAAADTYEARGTEVGLGRTRTADGRIMILTCADPNVFRSRYPTQPFNADMHAVAVLQTALANSDCGGILINSATTIHSLPLDRSQIDELLG